jgi:hypothetical protein
MLVANALVCAAARWHKVQVKEAAAGHACRNAYLLLTEASTLLLVELSDGLPVRLTRCSCSCSRYVSASLFEQKPASKSDALKKTFYNT